MSLDIAYAHNVPYDEQNEFIFNELLIAIEDKLLAISDKKLVDFGLPAPNRTTERHSHEWMRENNFDINRLDILVTIISILLMNLSMASLNLNTKIQS